MSALKKNPFLIGFIVVMVLGVGALGYLTYTAADEHSAAREEYDQAASELKRLQGLRPFPNSEHLKKFQAQREEVQAKVTALQKDMSAVKIKQEEISPSEFQNKLRDTVARVTAKAGESNVKLPDKFYMGMPKYQSEPPNAAAARPLYRELRALEAVMNVILEVKNVDVRELTREDLKEEGNVKPPPPDPKNRNKPAAAADARKLVETDKFTIKFATSQENFQRILNGIVTHKDQFFIPRVIALTNEKADAPPKAQAVAAVTPGPPPTGGPDGPKPTVPPGTPDATTPPAPAAPEAPKLEYVFGKEAVEVTMDLDLVDVREPEAAPEAKPSPKK
jgi:hypothetical protein